MNKLFLSSLFAVLLLSACVATDNEADYTDVRISFVLPQGEAGTRAASALPVGATLRVVAYRYTAGQSGMPEANRADECTYKVVSGGLTPCAVNADGTEDTGSPAVTGDMSLAPGQYIFYAISPAIRVYHEVDNPMVAVNQGMAFASAATTATTIDGAAAGTTVSLPALDRKCALLQFTTDRKGGALTGITSIKVQSLTLEEMTDGPAWATGTGALASTGNTNSTSVVLPAASFTQVGGNAWQQTAQTYCLPRAAGDFRVRASLLFNRDTTPTVLQATVTNQALKAGVRNGFTLYLGNGTMEVKPTDLWTDTTKEDEVFGGYNLNVGGKSANCYIVTGNEIGSRTTNYVFDCTVRGNNATGVTGINYNTLPDLSTVTEARVLWEQGSSPGSVVKTASLNTAKKKVFFTLGDDTEGNAVIGIFASSAADAPCLWSWHIWRLPSKPADVACRKYLNGDINKEVSFTMMDRNLGAYNNTQGNVNSIGFFYQWGRKDPFPGPSGFNNSEPTNIYGSYNKGGTTGSWNGTYSAQAVQTNATVGTELYTVQYPTTFVTGTRDNGDYDWYWGSRNDNLWGTPWDDTGSVNNYNGNQGTKSIYDPCPIGYRVPPQDFANKAVSSGAWTNGQSLTGISSSAFWFPATGLRAMGGALSNFVCGYCWSSSPNYASSVYCGYLAMADGFLDAQSDSNRAFSSPVRCVSE